MTCFCCFAVWVVLHWAERLDPDEYSNPEDFPVAFAHRMVGLVLTAVVLLWIAAIADSRAATAVLEFLLAAMSVMVLISALHPHRHQEPEEERETPAPGEAASPAADTTDPAAQVYSYNLSLAKTRAIEMAIRKVVEGQEAFLEPHLTVQDVATRCGYNRTYVAGVFKTQLGGFFTYVNTLRLDYFDAYLAAHPKASIAEVASESGFGSRASYYAVKAKFQGDDNR